MKNRDLLRAIERTVDIIDTHPKIGGRAFRIRSICNLAADIIEDGITEGALNAELADAIDTYRRNPPPEEDADRERRKIRVLVEVIDVIAAIQEH